MSLKAYTLIAWHCHCRQAVTKWHHHNEYTWQKYPQKNWVLTTLSFNVVNSVSSRPCAKRVKCCNRCKPIQVQTRYIMQFDGCDWLSLFLYSNIHNDLTAVDCVSREHVTSRGPMRAIARFYHPSLCPITKRWGQTQGLQCLSHHTVSTLCLQHKLCNYSKFKHIHKLFKFHNISMLFVQTSTYIHLIHTTSIMYSYHHYITRINCYTATYQLVCWAPLPDMRILHLMHTPLYHY